MMCPACQTELPAGIQFCPSCGSPGRSGPAPSASPAMSADSGRFAGGSSGESPTRVLTSPAEDTEPPMVREPVATDRATAPRVVPARRTAARVQERLGATADRFRAWPLGWQLAVVGAIITVIGFLLLPYADGAGRAAEIGGRLWWRPILAVVAAVLVVAGRRSHHARVAAVAVAAGGVAEAGLLGLVSGDARGAEVGFYTMLVGLGLTLGGALAAAAPTHAAVGDPYPTE